MRKEDITNNVVKMHSPTTQIKSSKGTFSHVLLVVTYHRETFQRNYECAREASMYECMYVWMHHAWMYECMNASCIMHEWMNAWMNECMNACINVCMYVWMYECMNVCMYVWMYECMIVWMHVCMYACMYECMYVWMHVCMNAWLYECMYVSLFSSSKKDQKRSITSKKLTLRKKTRIKPGTKWYRTKQSSTKPFYIFDYQSPPRSPLPSLW